MTRTPTDMETAMSDGTKERTLVHTQFDGQGRMIWQVEGLPEHVQAIHKMYEALSALGDPVVVAEALPELVEAADGIEKLRFFIKVKAEKQQEALLHLAKIKDAIASMKARP